MNGSVRSNAWNSEAGALPHRHGFGQWGHLLHSNDDVLGGGAERAIRLGAETPHTAAEPFLRDSFADGVNRPGAIAVRNDARIRHSDTESIFTFFHVTGMDARRRHTNASFSGDRLRVVHRTDDQNVARRALFFVPCSFHDFAVPSARFAKAKAIRTIDAGTSAMAPA